MTNHTSIKKIIIMLTALTMAVMLIGSFVWAQEAPELISIEEPSLTDTGYIMVENYMDIPVNPASVEVTELDAENALNVFLSGKSEGETDEEYIQRYAEKYLNQDIQTADEMREYLKEDAYHTALQNEIMDVLRERAYVESYPEETFAILKEYASQELDREVEMNRLFGDEIWNAETAVEELGYASVEDYLIESAMYRGKDIMILDELASIERITYTDADVETAIRELMDYYGYSNEMTLEEYIEYNGGDCWKFMVEKLNVEYHKVLSAMEKYVVMEDSGQAENAGTQGVQAAPAEDVLAAFTATTLDGDTVSQELFSGKDVTILNLWATWCGFCLDEMPVLAEYAAGLPDNVQLVTYCLDGMDAAELAKQIMEESGLSAQDVPALTNGSGDFERILSKVMFIPCTFFINGKGEFVGEPLVGGQQDLKASLDACVEQALAS